MIAIIDYGAGNTESIQNALKKLGQKSIVTDDIQKIKAADKVIFPGVGQARTAMRILRKKGLEKEIPKLQQPVLGICLGLQLMCKDTEEGNIKGLGIFDASVKKFPSIDKVPHMGWNSLIDKNSALFKGVDALTDVYFVHTYYAQISPETVATAQYSTAFSAAMQKNNFYATQFHPEKSSEAGMQILKNFLAL